MTTKQYDNYADLITFTRASTGTALRHVGYGSELVTNGTFDTASDWTFGSTADGQVYSISSGQLTITKGATADGTVEQTITGLTIGSVYELKIDVVSTDGSNRIDFVTSAASAPLPYSTATGTRTAYVVATSTSHLLRVNKGGSGGQTAVFDNISVKEVIFDRATDPLVLFNHPTNTPRIEYDADGNRKGLLIEEARTNSFVWSEDFTNVAWIKSGVTVTANAIAAPDGNTTADKIEKTTTDTTTPAQTVSTTAGQTWVWSVFVKDDSSAGWLRLRSDNTGSVVNVFVNYKTGVVGVGGLTAGVEDFGNGWKRVYAVRTTPNTGVVSFSFCAVNADGGSDPTGESVYFWGAQAEAGSFPTSYIPTAGAAASRAADVASIPTSAFGYNADKGTVVVDFEVSNYVSGSRRLFSLNTNSQNRVDGLLVSNGQFQQFVVVGNVGQVSENSGNSITNNEPSKAAAVYALNDFASVLDGGAVQTDTSGTVPSVNTLSIGTSPVNNWTNGYLKSIQYYPRRLTNTQLQELTS